MKEKTYNVIICSLAIMSMVLAVIDFTKGLNAVLKTADLTIYIIFIFDYIIRLFLSASKIIFIKSNILDLIAILPFNSVFRIFRVVKIARLARLAKLSKISKTTKVLRFGSVSARLLYKVKRFLNTNGFKYVLLLSATFVLAGAFGIMYFENMTFQDALWWSFVTATTVGYGDLSPTTGAGRIIASLLMLVGIGLIGSLTSSITSYFLLGHDNETVSNDKINMLMVMYNSLSVEEKTLFKNILKNEEENI